MGSLKRCKIVANELFEVRKRDKYPSMGNRQTKPSESSIGTSGSIEPLRRSVGNDLIEGLIDRRSTSSVDGAPQLRSLSEITRQSVPSSRTSTISGLSGQKRRKTLRELRQIRDEPNRLCRKASVAPDEAFIVEEVLLEDLCALAGEEALEGGNIILSREKEELISRLSKNPETADVFKTTTIVRKFSTNSLRGELPNGILDSQPRISCRVSQSTRLSQSSMESIQTARLSRGSQSGSYINGSNRGSNQSSHSDIHNESRGAVDDTVKLRRISIKQAQTTCPKGVHELMTQSNYRTEIQALKVAQKRESCTCARNCFLLCNIYI